MLEPEVEAEEKVGPERLRLRLRVVVAAAPMARRVAALNRHRHPREPRKPLRPRLAMEAADRLRHQVVQLLKPGVEHLPRPNHRQLHPQPLETPHPLQTLSAKLELRLGSHHHPLRPHRLVPPMPVNRRPRQGSVERLVRTDVPRQIARQIQPLRRRLHRHLQTPPHTR